MDLCRADSVIVEMFSYFTTSFNCNSRYVLLYELTRLVIDLCARSQSSSHPDL